MSTVTIREAHAGDAAALAELRYALRASTGIATEPKPEFIDRCREWIYQHLVQDGLWRCWVAESDQKPDRQGGCTHEGLLSEGTLPDGRVSANGIADDDLLGCIWLQLVEKIPNPRAEREHHAYITSFFVKESARASGIGTRLLTAVLDWCSGQDVHEIILWPTERSRSSYQRHGFAVPTNILQLINAPED